MSTRSLTLASDKLTYNSPVFRRVQTCEFYKPPNERAVRRLSSDLIVSGEPKLCEISKGSQAK